MYITRKVVAFNLRLIKCMNFANCERKPSSADETSLLFIIHNCLTLGKSFAQKLKEILKEKRVMLSKKKHYPFLMKCFTAAEAAVKANLSFDIG